MLIDLSGKHDLLSKHQFGFRQNSSTVHLLCNIYDQIIKIADNSLYSCFIFLDLTKPFDTMDHTILLNKMHYHIGIWVIAEPLIRSNLSNRMQYTKLYNYKSQLANVTHAVPKGFLLGPLLFLMHMSDLPQAIQFQTMLFSDDTYLTMTENSLAKSTMRFFKLTLG